MVQAGERLKKLTKPNLKIAAEGNPYFVEALEEFMKDAKEGKTRGLALVSIDGDKIYTDWVTSDGTGVCELVGAVEILKTDMVDRMRDNGDV